MKISNQTWLTGVLALLVAATLATAGCDGSDGCESDHDCEDTDRYEMVCEPDGCMRACTEDADCPATDQCVPRRVEEGQICTEP